MSNGEVGKLSVRVVPDLKLFARELRAKLKKIRNDDFEVPVKPVLDKSAKERLRREIEELATDVEVEIEPTVDKDALHRARERIERALDGVDVGLEVSRASIARVKERLRNMSADVTLNVDLDKGAAQAKLAALTRPRTVKIVPVLDKVATGRVASALAALSGARLLSGSWSRLTDLVRSLDRVSLAAGAAAAGVVMLGNALTALSANVLVLGKGIGAMSPALLALPGVLAGAAVAGTVMWRALSRAKDVLADLGPAWKDLDDKIGAAFWDEAAQSVRDLSNEAMPVLQQRLQGVARETGRWARAMARVTAGNLPVIDEALGNIGRATQKAVPGVADLTQGVIQLAAAGTRLLPGLAEQFNRVSESFARWATRSANDGSIERAVNRGVVAMTKLWKITKDTGGVFAGLTRAAEEGGYHLDRMVATMHGLHRAVDSVAGQTGLANIFEGASSGMDELFKKVTSLGEEFVVISRTMRLIGILGGQIAGLTFEGLFKGMATKEFGSGVTDFFLGVRDGVKALTDASPAIGGVVGAVARLSGAFARSGGRALATAFEELGPSIEKVLNALGPLVEALGGSLAGAIKKVSPSIEKLVDKAIVPLINKMTENPEAVLAFGAALGALGVVGKVIGPLVSFGSTVSSLVGTLTGGSAAAGGLSSAFGALAGPIGIAVGVVAACAAAFAAAWASSESFRETIRGIFDGVAERWQGFVDWFNTNLKPILTTVWNDAQAAMATVKEWIANEFVPAWQNMMEGISAFWDAYGRPTFETIKTFVEGFLQGWQATWDSVKTIFSGAWEVISSLATFFTGSVGNILKIFSQVMTGDWSGAWQTMKDQCVLAWDTIKGVVSGAWSIIQGIISLGVNTVKNIWNGAWNVIGDVVTGAWTRIKTAVSTGVGQVVSTVTSLPGRASSALGNIGSTLWNAGKDLIQGFIDGIKSKFSSVQSTLTSLTGKLTSWKGPESLDKVILRQSGRWVIGGFIDGLEDAIPGVEDALRSLTTALPPMVAEVGVDAPESGQSWDGAAGGANVTVNQYYPVAERESAVRDAAAQGVRMAVAF